LPDFQGFFFSSQVRLVKFSFSPSRVARFVKVVVEDFYGGQGAALQYFMGEAE